MSLNPEEGEHTGPVVRDKRRIDPVTGEVRERHDAAPAAPSTETPEEQHEVVSDTTSVEAELAERTADLQRLQAEYLNYKRRVDRDKENARKNGVASTLSALLPVLDDVARARDHGELTGGFKAVSDSLERATEKLGLTPFGEVGDEFDPRIHDALTHTYSDEVTGPTCLAIVQVGYRIDDRVLRPAMVAVAEPTVAIEAPASASDDEGGSSSVGVNDPGDDAGAGDHPDSGSTTDASYDDDGDAPRQRSGD